MYKSQLVSLKPSLTDVPTNIYTKDWKPIDPMIGNLDQFLGNNDCLKTDEFQKCYLHTRLLLIGTTKELDASNDRINGLNQVIDQLIGNINAIIDNFDDGATDKTKLSIKLVK